MSVSQALALGPMLFLIYIIYLFKLGEGIFPVLRTTLVLHISHRTLDLAIDVNYDLSQLRERFFKLCMLLGSTTKMLPSFTQREEIFFVERLRLKIITA